MRGEKEEKLLLQKGRNTTAWGLEQFLGCPAAGRRLKDLNCGSKYMGMWVRYKAISFFFYCYLFLCGPTPSFIFVLPLNWAY